MCSSAKRPADSRIIPCSSLRPQGSELRADVNVLAIVLLSSLAEKGAQTVACLRSTKIHAVQRGFEANSVGEGPILCAVTQAFCQCEADRVALDQSRNELQRFGTQGGGFA